MNSGSYKTNQPMAKAAGLMVTEMDEDTLVYNLDNYRAVSLNQTAESIRKLCDGTRDVHAIASFVGVSEAVTAKVHRDLDRNGLLEPGFDSITLLGRRKFLSSVAKGSAAAAAAVPIVLATTLPAAAQAASCLPKNTPCSFNSQCCSGDCKNGKCHIN